MVIIDVSLQAEEAEKHDMEGRYACPCLHEMRLEVHDRISGRDGVDALKTQLLNNFSVAGHGNAFVYRDKRGCVYYLLLSTHSTPRVNPATPGDSQVPPAMVTPLASRRSFHSASFFGSVDEAPTMNSILLRVHGVQAPGPEITVELYGFLRKSIEVRLPLLTPTPLLGRCV